MSLQRPAKRSNIKVILSKILIVVFALAALIGGSTALNDQPHPLVETAQYELVTLPDTSGLARQPIVVLQAQPSR